MSTEEFPVGARVILVELTKAPQYNGKQGVVKTSLNANGRQQVLVPQLSKTMSLRISNLKYEPRPASSLSIKDLKTVLKDKNVKDNVTGMDIADLRGIVEQHADSPEEIAEILARAAVPPVPKASTSTTNMNRADFQNQMDSVSHMTPEQMRQQARTMRAMDPATIRRMNPQLANMTDEQIRMAADQMEAMSANPAMFQMAKEQMKNMTPEQMQQHVDQASAMAGQGNSSSTSSSSGSTAAASAVVPPQDYQQQLDNLSPEQLKQQAQAMRNMDPDTIRRMNPQFASMTDEQIKAAASQMESMASNPEMFNMMRDQMKHMSPQDLQHAMQQGGSASGTNHATSTMDPSKIAENMDPKQLKQMFNMIKENPALMKQAMASNPAMANMSEEQLANGLDMFSEMDDATLARAMGMVNKVSKVTQPVSNAYGRVNKAVGGHLFKILFFLLLACIGSIVYMWIGKGSGGSVGLDEVVMQEAQPETVGRENQDEFATEF